MFTPPVAKTARVITFSINSQKLYVGCTIRKDQFFQLEDQITEKTKQTKKKLPAKS